MVFWQGEGGFEHWSLSCLALMWQTPHRRRHTLLLPRRGPSRIPHSRSYSRINPSIVQQPTRAPPRFLLLLPSPTARPIHPSRPLPSRSRASRSEHHHWRVRLPGTLGWVALACACVRHRLHRLDPADASGLPGGSRPSPSPRQCQTLHVRNRPPPLRSAHPNACHGQLPPGDLARDDVSRISPPVAVGETCRTSGSPGTDIIDSASWRAEGTVVRDR
jgi:hypothetical protein